MANSSLFSALIVCIVLMHNIFRFSVYIRVRDLSERWPVSLVRYYASYKFLEMSWSVLLSLGQNQRIVVVSGHHWSPVVKLFSHQKPRIFLRATTLDTGVAHGFRSYIFQFAMGSGTL